MPTQEDVFQDDVLDLLRAAGLSDHARPKSPHRVVQDEVIPAVREMRLTWTDEPPTEPGWYWVRNTTDKHKDHYGIHYVVVEDESFHIRTRHPDSPPIEDLGPEWEFAGPIPQPVES